MKPLKQLINKYHSIIIILLFLLAIVVRIVYMSYTSYNVRGYDAEDHLSYIKFVANNFRIPPPDQGWEYHQAPLYYITAATVYKLSLNKTESVQVLSLIYSSLFLLFGILILQKMFNNRILFYNASLLFLFWPSNIVHAIRIGNDPMYYMMSTIALYFLIKWVSSHKQKDFYITALFTTLTLGVKLNGTILVILVLATIFYKYFNERKIQKCLKYTGILITGIILIYSISFSRNIKLAISQKNFNLLNGNTATNMNPELRVKNELTNYIIFNPKLLISQTFTTPWDDSGGRQLFWNYLYKTMLFGEFNYTTPFIITPAAIINIIFIDMSFFFLVGLIYVLRTLTLSKTILSMHLLLSVISLIYYRYSFPFSSNGDFRFIFPSIIPCIYFYFSGIEYFTKQKRKLLGIVGYIFIYIFITCTCLFFLSPLSP